MAGYSLLVLASSIACGFERSDDFLPLPKWRGKSIRPFILNLLNLPRQRREVAENRNPPESLSTYAA